MDPKRVLFVCMGNICRSPAAEGVLRKAIENAGLSDSIQVGSAGTIGYHAGELPDVRMRKAAEQRGYRLQSRARQVEPRDLATHDLVIALDRENLADLQSLDREQRYAAKIHLLCDFIPDCELHDVPDPYYGGDAGFHKVIDLIERAVPGILRRIENGEKP